MNPYIKSTYSSFQEEMRKKSRNLKYALCTLVGLGLATGMKTCNDYINKDYNQNFELVSKIEMEYKDKQEIATKLKEVDLALRNGSLVAASDGVYLVAPNENGEFDKKKIPISELEKLL